MGYAIGQVTNSGGKLAHQNMLGVIKTLAEANGWVTLRYDDVSDDHELILKGEGLSGTEEIFVGFKCYQSISGDFYNIAAATLVGYVASNEFEAQPAASISGVPCHNLVANYFITCNEQRIAGCFKVGTPVYEHFYEGKCFAYARPGEFPSPLIAGGMFNGAEAKRYSDLTQSFPYKGDAQGVLRMRTQAGAWIAPRTWPYYDRFNNNYEVLAGPASGNDSRRCLVALNDQYAPLPIILFDETPNVYGQLDGVYFITAFNNGTENVLQVGGTPVDQTSLSIADAVAELLATDGRAFVVLQDVY